MDPVGNISLPSQQYCSLFFLFLMTYVIFQKIISKQVMTYIIGYLNSCWDF